MHIRLKVIGLVHLNDSVNVIDVNSSCCHIGGNKNVHATRGELLQVAGSPRLVQITVKTDGGNTVVVQVVRKLLSEGASPGEHQHLAGTLSKLQDHVALLSLVHNPHTVVDAGGLLVFSGNLKDCGVGEELCDDSCNTGVQRGGEQQALPRR